MTQPKLRRRPRELAFVAGALGVPLGVGSAVSALTGSRRAGLIAGGATLALAGALRWQLQRWFTDQPAYEVERRIGGLEIRRYAPRVEARTWIGASFEQALDQGFRRLAGYIFGGNADRQRVAMTAPVASREADTGAGRFVMFTMPPGKTLADLPRPDDPNVELREIPTRRIAVLRFRGRYTADQLETHTRRLRQLVADAGLVATGEPVFAGYDPPMTLPFLRRVEVWQELA